MAKSKKPKKWTQVYPQGTKEGDEEQSLFISLSRNPKWQWRSVAQLAAESNLTKVRVEEILNKYFKRGMVFQNPSNSDQWGYWERVPHMLPDDTSTIAKKDQKKRIDDSMGDAATIIVSGSGGSSGCCGNTGNSGNCGGNC